jgi:hypothetical protein
MVRKITLAFLTVAVTLALQGVASAHSVSIVAAASCGNTGPVISYTASTNGFDATVTISFNNVQVDSAVLNSVDNWTLSGSKSAPGGSVSVSATAVWTDGFPTSTASTLVVVPTSCATSSPGRFTGGGKEVDLNTGVTITKGFEVDCDLTKPDNLELNWAPANNFHMDVLTSANCFDDPLFDQNPPTAPVNTIIGVGTGKFNGNPNYTINFTLVDGGEPGTNDRGGFTITAPDGTTVVLNFPEVVVTSGNIQAHVDQK